MALRTLNQTLLDSDLARLRVMARQWGVTLTAERKPDMAAELADAMARAEAVERVVAQLDEKERAALDELLRQGGALPWAIFTRRWGELRPVGPGRLEREELWRTPISAVERLWYLGLVQRAFAPGPAGQVEMAFIPEELRLYMPEPVALEITPPPPTSAPAHQIMGSDVLADDLTTLFAALQTEAVNPAAAARRAIPMRLPEAGALLETLALEQGWIRHDEHGSTRLVPDAVLKWLRLDRWSQWAALARAWVESTRWNDLAAVPTLRPDPVREWPSEPLAVRRAFLALLSRCLPDTWYTLTDFTAYVYEQHMDFLRPDGDYNAWTLRDAATDRPLRGLEAWNVIEGALITFLLSGPLAWLGLVDVGGSAPSLPPTAFRLSVAGEALLHSAEPPTLPDPPAVRLGDDGTLLVPPRRRYERFQLQRIAHPLGWDNGYRYRFTPTSLELARRQRIPLERIMTFLEDVSGRSLPTSLRTAIEKAYHGSASVRLEHVWLLRVPDAALLDHPALQRAIDEHIDAHTAIIHESACEQVVLMLVHLGILPEVNFTS